MKPPPASECVPREAWDALAPEWRALWRACGASAFQTPELVTAWADAYAPGRAVALTLRQDGRLVALAALFAWEGALLFAGTGPFDVGDALIAPGAPEETAQALLAAIAHEGQKRGCARLDLQQIPCASPLLACEAPPGWIVAHGAGEACSAAPLSGADGLGALDAVRRRKLAYTRRLVARHGHALAHRIVPPSDVPQASEMLIRLHAARWRAAGEPGVLACPMMQRFVRAALPAAAQTGLLRLHEIALDGAPAALLCAFHAGGRAELYLSAVDPEAMSFGPGSLCTAAAFAAAAAEGLTRADFLRGDEPYKAAWGATPVPMARCLVRQADA